MKNILIIGASNHAKVIINILESHKEFNLCGIIDASLPVGTLFNGLTVLGTLKDVPDLIANYNIYGGVIAIENNSDRKAMMEKIQNIARDFKFIKTISPLAVLGKEVRIGPGTVIYPRAVINAAAHVGAGCIIKSNTSLGHDSCLNDFASMSFRVHIGGNVSIGVGSNLENGVKILENINIGNHEFIERGQLVRKDILK